VDNYFTTGQTPWGKAETIESLSGSFEDRIPSNNQYLSGPDSLAYESEMMSDPQFAELVNSLINQKKKKSLVDLLAAKDEQEVGLMKQLPKLKEIQAKIKAQEKVQKLHRMQQSLQKSQLDSMVEQAENLAQQRLGGQQHGQGMP
jgi:hypothetical protein